MKATTVTSAIMVALGGLVMMFSVQIPNWRKGVGTRFLADVDGVIDFNTYDYRYYGPVWIYGTYTMPWTTLARASCDKAMTFIGLDLLDTAVGAISSGENTYCPACPDSMAGHFKMRCDMYNKVSSISTACSLLAFLSFGTGIGCVFTIFFARLGNIKGLVFGTLLFGNFCGWLAWFMWLYVTHNAFITLGLSATYPYPTMYTGAYMFMAGALLQLSGILMFGVFKIFIKWFYEDGGKQGLVQPDWAKGKGKGKGQGTLDYGHPAPMPPASPPPEPVAPGQPVPPDMLGPQ